MECPKCGSDRGFSYYATLRTERRGYWGTDSDEEVFLLKMSVPKTVKCDDCGARVNMDYAHGKGTDPRPGHIKSAEGQ